MKNVTVGYDKELGELITKSPKKWNLDDDGDYWLSAVVGVGTLIGFFWTAFMYSFINGTLTNSCNSKR